MTSMKNYLVFGAFPGNQERFYHILYKKATPSTSDENKCVILAVKMPGTEFGAGKNISKSAEAVLFPVLCKGIR